MKLVILFILSIYFIGCSDKKADLFFEKKEISLNDVRIGGTYDFYFLIKNTGRKPLLVKNVVGDCECINLKWPQKEVYINSIDTISGSIKINEKGPFKKIVMVYANTDSVFHTLWINGNGVEN